MRAIIVNYMDTVKLSDICVILTDDGDPLIFEDTFAAQIYAETSLNGVSRIVACP